MELMIFIMLFVVIMIMTKLSHIENQLSSIKKSLRTIQRDSFKSKSALSVAQKVIPQKDTAKKSMVKKPIVEKPLTQNPSSNFEILEPHIISFEELFFGNIILKISIVAFILGIALFLKYSIEHNWIPMSMRVFIGVIIGIGMLQGGIKMINNRHKLFSEVLFGGGIAVLYLSIYTAFALTTHPLIGAEIAFVLMIAITVVAGLLSIRFDAKSTAIFGLIGGFSTPFLLGAGGEYYLGVLSYMLLLNLGILYISIYKNWSILSWMAFGITSFTQLSVVWETERDFYALFILYALFYIIYSIVPFIKDIQERKESLSQSSITLFWVNSMVVILSFLSLFKQYGIDSTYYFTVTMPLAGFLLIYASFLRKENLLLKDLFYILFAQAIMLLLVTPLFLFDATYLTSVLALESLMLMWVLIKSEKKVYGIFSLLGFGATGIHYILVDMMHNHISMEITLYINTLAIDSLFVIGSFYIGYLQLKESKLDKEYQLSSIMLGVVVWFLFLFLNIEVYQIIKLSSEVGAKIAITLLWIIFGIAMFVYGRVKNIETSKTIGIALIFIAILKAFVSDLTNLDTIYRIILFLILGMLLFGVSYFYQKNMDEKR